MRTRGSFPDAIEAQLVPVCDQLITSRCVARALRRRRLLGIRRAVARRIH